jgi:Zn-dependent peptidase ImmA (M78 family)
VKFERGFKSGCERIALEIRGELRLAADDRIDPFLLAEHLAIPVSPLAKLKTLCPGAVDQFHNGDRNLLSAFTVFEGKKRFIFYNEKNAPTRRSNDICHEISHCLLEHEPGPVMDDGGNRLWKPEIEKQADYLAGAILIPSDGAYELRRQGHSVDGIAAHFGVSGALSRMRVQMTGVEVRLARLNRKFGRP